MESKAKVSFIRVTPRKMGLVADMVRGKNINDALKILRFSSKKRIATVILKAIKSAAANADQKGTADVDRLFVKEILIGKGPTLKRFRPRAKGSAHQRLKYTSHVSVKLAEK